MSSAWTPAAGMLCEASREDGKPWRFIRLINRYGLMVADVGNGLGSYDRSDLKPLAPAVTPGGLFEALLQVPGAEVCTTGASVIRLNLEAGQLRFYDRDAGSWQVVYVPDQISWVTQEYGDAVCEDWRKVTAIRAYAAQPGWGGGE